MRHMALNYFKLHYQLSLVRLVFLWVLVPRWSWFSAVSPNTKERSTRRGCSFYQTRVPYCMNTPTSGGLTRTIFGTTPGPHETRMCGRVFRVSDFGMSLKEVGDYDKVLNPTLNPDA